MRPQPNNRYREYMLNIPSYIADLIKHVARDNKSTETEVIAWCIADTLITRNQQQAPAPTINTLSDEQIMSRLVAALGVGGRFTDDHVRHAVDWANETKVDYALFELVMHGMLSMSWNEEEWDWVFKRLDDETSRNLIRLADVVASMTEPAYDMDSAPAAYPDDEPVAYVAEAAD